MNFETQILEAKRVVLFLDFDGTLAPIVLRPAEAAMPPETFSALKVLAADEKYKVAFVSGRSAEDLERRAPLAGAIYAGNHGLEIHGAGPRFAIAEDPLLRLTLERLELALANIHGVEIEDKILSASVHFRRVPEQEWPLVEEAVLRIVPRKLNLRGGKMVFEIRPAVDWNKGSAVRWIITQLGLEDMCHVYIGDDLTDEDAFAVLPDGVTVHVGMAGNTAAKYRLRDTDEVGQLLQRLAQ